MCSKNIRDNSPVVVSNKCINKIPLEIRQLVDLNFVWANRLNVYNKCELFIYYKQTKLKF